MTARLSRLSHERLGDEIANELVDWFNHVDATYRGDLPELNALNFARFDAKLEQRVAELNARIDQLEARILARMEQRLAAHVRWLLAAWLSLMVPLLGLWFRL